MKKLLIIALTLSSISAYGYITSESNCAGHNPLVDAALKSHPNINQFGPLYMLPRFKSLACSGVFKCINSKDANNSTCKFLTTPNRSRDKSFYNAYYTIFNNLDPSVQVSQSFKTQMAKRLNNTYQQAGGSNLRLPALQRALSTKELWVNKTCSHEENMVNTARSLEDRKKVCTDAWNCASNSYLAGTNSTSSAACDKILTKGMPAALPDYYAFATMYYATKDPLLEKITQNMYQALSRQPGF